MSTTTDEGRAGLVRSSAAVATGTLLSRVTGLMRVVALAWALGAATLADTYNLANTTPNIMYELVLGGILAATIVPVFVRQIQQREERSTSAIFTVTLTALTALTLVAMAAAPLIARVFLIGTDGASRSAQLHVLTILLWCFLPQMVFYGLTALSTALLNAHGRFVAAAYAPVLNNVVVIGMIGIFAARTAHDRAAWSDAVRVRNDLGTLLLLGLGTTAGIVAMALVLLPALRRARVRLRPVFAWRDAGVRTIVRLSGWTVAYVATNQIAQLFVLVLAKSGTRGDVTAYVYAFTFYVLPHGLLAVSIMTTMTPELARRAGANDTPGLRRDYNLGLRYLIVLTVPASVLFAVLAQPIIGVMHLRNFTLHDVHVTGDALQLFAISLVPFSLYLYTFRAFYAMHDTRTPFFINAVENGINIALAIALFPTFGVQGLAMAWSVAYLVAAVINIVVLRRRIGAIPDRGVYTATGRAAVGAIALAAVAIPLAGAIGSATAARSVAAAVIAGAAGGAAYLLVLAAMRSAELSELARLLVGRRGGQAVGNMSP